VPEWAVRATDLQEILLRVRPQIVHFSGHGSTEKQELVFEDSGGKGRTVSAQAIGELFRILGDGIRCVVLNACYSELQARAIAHHVDGVVGVRGAIGDKDAIEFASSFYGGLDRSQLSDGKALKRAFDLGCNQIDLAGLTGAAVPKLLLRTRSYASGE